MKILSAPNPLLRKKSKALREVTAQTRKLIEKLISTLREDPLGIGLAAPQVGVLEQIIIIDRNVGQEEEDLVALVNPRVVSRRGKESRQEGCLSVPGFYAPVQRSSWVRVKALSKEGKPIELAGEGMLARVLLHEIDHLHGILFIDRVEDWQACELNESCLYTTQRVKELAHSGTSKSS